MCAMPQRSRMISTGCLNPLTDNSWAEREKISPKMRLNEKSIKRFTRIEKVRSRLKVKIENEI